jgi:putative toxin-antitoxin system antitoxin component (TIGR02293 family)
MLTNDQKAEIDLDALVSVTARAIEVLGTREKALRWLRIPIRSLGDRTPLSQLETPDGITRVEDVLGRIEHGVW